MSSKDFLKDILSKCAAVSNLPVQKTTSKTPPSTNMESSNHPYYDIALTMRRMNNNV